MYSQEKQQEYISLIRRILVMKPDSTILGIKSFLMSKDPPLKLDKNYINKLVNKIRKERAKRYDHYTINKVLAGFEEEIGELKKNLWSIINNPLTQKYEKISAIRELRTSSKDLFDKMFDSGIFEKKLGNLTIKDEKVLKDIDKLSKDEKRKFFGKLADARTIIEDSESSGKK